MKWGDIEMNKLYLYAGIFNEWGLEVYFPRYNEEEVEACALLLKLCGCYDLVTFGKVLVMYGLMKIV